MKICAVYLVFKHEQGELIDQVVRWVTGGKHVHVETVFVIQHKPVSVLAVGSLYPQGVYASDVLKDPYYHLYSHTGSSLPVDTKRGLGWTWVDITATFANDHYRQNALDWAITQVKHVQYRTSAFVTFPMPCSSSTTRSKRKVICSEFCADMMLKFCTPETHHRILPSLNQHCERLGGLVQGGTEKLSPQALYETLQSTGVGIVVPSATVRQLMRKTNPTTL